MNQYHYENKHYKNNFSLKSCSKTIFQNPPLSQSLWVEVQGFLSCSPHYQPCSLPLQAESQVRLGSMRATLSPSKNSPSKLKKNIVQLKMELTTNS